ncbi:hypothetical protein KY306_02875 [Candidatus Woesearchaeota archaeon]|nr:hypothetical protein [Candidatus Woesearchaeota archaeon]
MKRAQIKMGETIAILFIFFVLILFGLVFYFQWQKSSFERQKVETFSEQTISKSLLASFLPELICSKMGVPTKDCIDLDKLRLSDEKMKEELTYYFDLLGFTTIRVERLYPLESENEWILYDEKPAEISRKISTPMPVSLFEPISGKYYFGVLYVETYT